MPLAFGKAGARSACRLCIRYNDSKVFLQSFGHCTEGRAMKPTAVAIFMLLVALLPSLGHCRTWYIKVDGTGDAPTIQAGIDSAQAGDEVLVAPGEYTWTNQGTGDMYGSMIRMKSGVWLHSESGAEVTTLDTEGFWGTRPIACYNVDVNAVIEGFTITGGRSDYWAGLGGGGIHIEDSNPTIRDNIIEDNIASNVFGGSGGGGIQCHNTPRAVITNNIIRGNHAYYAGGGILCGICAINAPTITDNIIMDNTAGDKGGGICIMVADDVEIYHNLLIGNSAELGGAIFCADANGEIMNNTVLGDSAMDGAAIYFSNSSSPTVSRNIIAGSLGGPAFFCDGGSAPSIICNDLWDNQGGNGSCTLGADNFSSDPVFCDEVGGDYHLHEDSPCTASNSPSSCGLVGALSIGCWGAPLSSVGITVILVGLGAVGVWSVTRKMRADSA
jgi:hypothetical protein